MEIGKKRDSTKGEEEGDSSISTEEYLTKLRLKEKNLESPININITNMQEISLPQLTWRFYEVPPKKVKLNNSGHTGKLQIINTKLIANNSSYNINSDFMR